MKKCIKFCSIRKKRRIRSKNNENQSSHKLVERSRLELILNYIATHFSSRLGKIIGIRGFEIDAVSIIIGR
jgi:hypothetical protein